MVLEKKLGFDFECLLSLIKKRRILPIFSDYLYYNPDIIEALIDLPHIRHLRLDLLILNATNEPWELSE